MRGRFGFALLVALLPAACSGGSSAPSVAPSASPSPVATPYIAYELAAGQTAVTAPAPGPIVLFPATRSYPIGPVALATTVQPPYPCPTGQVCAVPPVAIAINYAIGDPTIAGISTTDPASGNPPRTAAYGSTYLRLVGYGKTALTALSGSTQLASATVYTYRTADLSCDIGGVSGLTVAADGTVTTATAPASADVYFTAPLFAGVGACMNPAFVTATTSPLTFPSGATAVPVAQRSAFTTIGVSAWRNDFTVAPATTGPVAYVFRARSGATVKYMSPGFYEAAAAGAADFPY